MNKRLQTFLSDRSFAKISSRWRSGTAPQPNPETMDDILRDLVTIPSVTGDREAIHQALEYVDHYLSERALHVRRFEWEGVESLIATTQRTNTPRVYLMAHLDVVPGDPQLFKLTEKDGVYYGRGVFDMKFAVASYLQIVEELQDRLHEYDFGLMIVADEEVGGHNGAQKFVEQGYLPDVIVIPDGGDNWAIETFAKGVWHIKLAAEGRNAHASRPWEGESATHKLMRAISDIQKLFDLGDPRKGSTCNVGILQGGQVTNQVAASATASLDIRTASKTDHLRLQKQIARICEKHDIVIETEAEGLPVIIDPKHPLITAFTDAITEVTGKPAAQTMSYAATDGRWFCGAGVPCAMVRPPGGNLHGPNEHISVEGFHQLKDVLLAYLEKTARIS
jgi:succinyl-diaminopimelate desuccinylase